MVTVGELVQVGFSRESAEKLIASPHFSRFKKWDGQGIAARLKEYVTTFQELTNTHPDMQSDAQAYAKIIRICSSNPSFLGYIPRRSIQRIVDAYNVTPAAAVSAVLKYPGFIGRDHQEIRSRIKHWSRVLRVKESKLIQLVMDAPKAGTYSNERNRKVYRESLAALRDVQKEFASRHTGTPFPIDAKALPTVLLDGFRSKYAASPDKKTNSGFSEVRHAIRTRLRIRTGLQAPSTGPAPSSTSRRRRRGLK